jgi:hypothetical protein
MTSLDLSSAFLQVPFEQYSRQLTAFQFDISVNQLNKNNFLRFQEQPNNIHEGFRKGFRGLWSKQKFGYVRN